MTGWRCGDIQDGSTSRLDPMTEMATAEDDATAESDLGQERWVFFRTHGRKLLYGYTIVLLVVISIQSVCLFFLWRPPQDWVSFIARFVTSPAFAGVFAVIAATIGARQLAKQLLHTKKKAADEAWWQQFEWVTDRIITPDKGGKTSGSKLPMSLALDLIASLTTIADGPFQKSAVEGIANHYLLDFTKLPQDDSEGRGAPETTIPSSERAEDPSSEGSSMDEAAAKSLGNLLKHLPESSASSESARRALGAYYEQEVGSALRHRGFDVVLGARIVNGTQLLEADIIATRGSKKVIVDVKYSLRTLNGARMTAKGLRTMMAVERARYGVIVTPPSKTAALFAGDLAATSGIHIVQWEPSMRSSELLRQLDLVLGDTEP